MKCSGKEWDTCRVEKMGCTGCHYAEADEVFKELGYENETNFFNKQTCECVYNKYTQEQNRCIRFHKDKTIDGIGMELTMPELKAICKKCHELGWI